MLDLSKQSSNKRGTLTRPLKTCSPVLVFNFWNQWPSPGFPDFIHSSYLETAIICSVPDGTWGLVLLPLTRMMYFPPRNYLALSGSVLNAEDLISSPSDIITCGCQEQKLKEILSSVLKNPYWRWILEGLSWNCKKIFLRREVWNSYCFKINKKLLSAEKGKRSQYLPIIFPFVVLLRI